MKANTHIFPKAWGTYVVCFTAALITGLESADLPNRSLLGFIGVPIMLLMVHFLLLLNPVRLRGLIREHCWKGCLLLLACIIALPAGSFAGDKLIDGRFVFNHDRYEKVAEQIYQGGGYILPLHDEDAYLGRRADTIESEGTGDHELNKRRYWSSRGIVVPEKNYYQLPWGANAYDAFKHVMTIAAEHSGSDMTFFSNDPLGVCWVATAPISSSN